MMKIIYGWILQEETVESAGKQEEKSNGNARHVVAEAERRVVGVAPASW